VSLSVMLHIFFIVESNEAIDKDNLVHAMFSFTRIRPADGVLPRY